MQLDPHNHIGLVGHSTVQVCKLPAVGLYPVGIATEAAGRGINTMRVRLDGIATAA